MFSLYTTATTVKNDLDETLYTQTMTTVSNTATAP
jgi:hypothetical protein